MGPLLLLDFSFWGLISFLEIPFSAETFSFFFVGLLLGESVLLGDLFLGFLSAPYDAS